MDVKTIIQPIQSVNTKRLDEIALMRPILIILVVLYHAMAIHTGNWSLPEGTVQIGLYAAVGRIAYIFMLESFVFISGYLYAYQRSKRGEDNFSMLVRKKWKRLLLPCWLFGILYALMFGWSSSILETIMAVITGIGHLWFLFMLFGCFVITWVLLFLKFRIWFIMLLLFVVSLFSFIILPFQLSNLMYFLFFFFMGFYFYSGRQFFVKKIRILHIICAWLLFVLLYILLDYARAYCKNILEEGEMLEVCKKAVRVIYSFIGTVAFYLTSLFIMRNRKLPKWYVEVGMACFGVYIFQQFVLHILYYETHLPSLLEPTVLPWLAFVITLIVSMALTWLIRRTELGRQML